MFIQPATFLALYARTCSELNPDRIMWSLENICLSEGGTDKVLQLVLFISNIPYIFLGIVLYPKYIYLNLDKVFMRAKEYTGITLC